MRRFLVAASLMTVIGASMVPSHAAVNTVVAVPGSFVAGWATPEVVISKSGPANLVNLDVESHTFTSVAKKPNDPTKPLFNVAANTGEVKAIDLSSVPPGEYAFFCAPHPATMKGNVTIVA